MSTTVTYKDETLVTVSKNTKTLKTAGKYMEDDVVITDTGPTIQSLSVTPSETAQSFNASSVDGYKPVSVSAVSSTYVGSGIARKSSSDLTASGATVTAPAGYYASAASKSVTTMTLPTAAASSATSGYTSKATIGRSTSAQYINIPPGYNSAGGYYTVSAVANGTAGTPTASKGTVSGNAVSVTPSVTNTTGYITGGTKTGTAVSVAASELVSGTLSITANGTTGVTNYASVSVNVTPKVSTAAINLSWQSATINLAGGAQAPLAFGIIDYQSTSGSNSSRIIALAGRFTSGGTGNGYYIYVNNSKYYSKSISNSDMTFNGDSIVIQLSGSPVSFSGNYQYYICYK